MPANPPANIADWATVMPPVMITAQAQMRNGQVPGDVQESKILVTIKQGGSKKYGSFTQDNAPSAGFNATVKSWSGSNAASLLGNSNTLPPGTYELCVQFFSYQTPAKALSNEVCKTFTIQGNKIENYSPPVNVSPVDKKIFGDKEIKTPITFRWTPILPRPQEPIVYKLKVWQLMQGQTGMQAIKSNQPVIDKDIKDITQVTINNLYIGPCKPPYLCDFIWSIEAVDRKGKILGVSEATTFSIGGENNKIMAAGCQMDFKIVSSTCEKGPNGNTIYTFCANLQDISTVPGTTMYFNDPLTFNCVNGTLTGCTSTSLSDLIKSPNGSISYIGVYPNTIPKVGGVIVCFTYAPSSPTATTALFKAFGVCATGTGTSANSSGSATPDTTVTLPPCPCNFCDQYKDWQFMQETAPTYSTAAPFGISLTSTIIAPNINIKSFKAELISFAHNGTEECFGCNKNDESFGNIKNGTFGPWGNGVFPLYATVTTHHTINWFGPTGATIQMAGQPVNINISAPPFSPLSCCDDEIKFCIRYSFTTADCQTCSYIKCYTVTRKHK